MIFCIKIVFQSRKKFLIEQNLINKKNAKKNIEWEMVLLIFKKMSKMPVWIFENFRDFFTKSFKIFSDKRNFSNSGFSCVVFGDKWKRSSSGCSRCWRRFFDNITGSNITYRNIKGTFNRNIYIGSWNKG